MTKLRRASRGWLIFLATIFATESNLYAEKVLESSFIAQEKGFSDSFYNRLKGLFGITYFSIFNGPGVLPENLGYSPNHLGKAANDGLNVLNQFSIRYKF